jgi:hypothetical protein
LQRLVGNAENPPVVPDLPRPGSQLAYVVQVLLGTNDEEKRNFLKHFIHQANVNRDKVVRCILGNEDPRASSVCALAIGGSERESQTVARQRHSFGIDFLAPQPQLV